MNEIQHSVPVQCLTEFGNSVPVQCFNEFQHSALSGLKCAVQGQGGRQGGRGEDDKAGDTFPFHRQQEREGSRGAVERRQGGRGSAGLCWTTRGRWERADMNGEKQLGLGRLGKKNFEAKDESRTVVEHHKNLRRIPCSD